MLQPIQVETASVERADPVRVCEACGHIVPGVEAMNIMIVIGVAGDPRINPFQCPAEEHWACSPECWARVAHACIDEHMGAVLQHQHNQLQTKHARPDTSGDTDPAIPVVKV